MSSFASVYFLSCCRPTFGSSFCYYVEHTKYINSDIYLNKPLKQGECSIHERLQDHCLNRPNKCTDYRAWSSDYEQQRTYFLDVASGRKNLCSTETADTIPRNREVEDKVLDKKEVKEEKPIKETEPPTKVPQVAVVAPSSTNVEIKKEPEIITKSSEYVKQKDEVSLKSPPPPYQSFDDADINNDMRKLDCNLSALEDTFYKFIGKNRCLIQNLVQCLNFEKQKQKELQVEYCNLKNDNEYLRMVNKKQIQLFRNELNKAISETKCVYSSKIQELHCEMQRYQEELQCYKNNEMRYLDAFENEKKEKTKLKCDVKSLKGKEVKLLKNYVKLLNFIGDVKKTLTSCSGDNRGYSLQRSSNTISDCDSSFDLKGVLRNALNNGIESLNIRDLSILHDAVQDVNERLCHQNDSCGVNPQTNMTISHLSMVYTSTEHCEEFPSSDGFQNDFQGYETSSNLSMYPSKQKPGDGYYKYC